MFEKASGFKSVRPESAIFKTESEALDDSLMFKLDHMEQGCSDKGGNGNTKVYVKKFALDLLPILTAYVEALGKAKK